MSLHLEGFSGDIRGHRSLVIGKEMDWLTRINIIEAESLYKGRSILVIYEPLRGSVNVGAAVLRRRWDSVFRIRESFDAQMLLTYVANSPKPVRILWHGSEVPRNLWQKWEKSDVTLIGCSRDGQLGCDWEVIFFPLQNTPQFVERTIGTRNVSTHLAEIAENGAALVWSNIGEDKKGSLYWYDPQENQDKMLITKTDAVSMLEEVCAWAGRV